MSVSTPRIFSDQPLTTGRTLHLEGNAARHLTQVLRLKRGASLSLFNGDGRDYEARILTTGKGRLSVEITGASSMEPEAPIPFILAQGISKGERMDYAIQKGVELGMGGLIPLFTERTVVRLEGERLERRLDHWRKVAIGACEQSGRRRLPVIGPAQRLEEWVSGLGEGTRLVLHHRAGNTLSELPPPEGRVYLLIGPEGGLCREELEWVGKQGFKPIRLGPRVLRTETAPLAALAAMQILWGDFR